MSLSFISDSISDLLEAEIPWLTEEFAEVLCNHIIVRYIIYNLIIYFCITVEFDFIN